MFACGNGTWSVVANVIHDGAESNIGNALRLCEAAEVDKELILTMVAAVTRVLDIACAEVLFGIKDIDWEPVLRCHPDRIRPLAVREAWRNSDCGACAIAELLMCDDTKIC